MEKRKGVYTIKRVRATEDIHCQGKVIIKRGAFGTVDSSGPYALNVKFDDYKHIVLCLWSMVSSHKEPKQLSLFD